jgi:hypothetical protein
MEYKKVRKKIVAMSMLGALLLSSMIITGEETIEPMDGVTMSMSPATPSVGKDETFVVNITIHPDEFIDAVSTDLIYFDPERLQCDDIEFGDLFSEETVLIPGTINNTEGTITLLCWGSSVPTNETGTFVNITFTAIDSGEAFIEIDDRIAAAARNGVRVSTFVDNNVVVTVYDYPEEPTEFIAEEAGRSQIDLHWYTDEMTDRTVIEWNTSPSWSRGEGTPLVNTTENFYDHTSLLENTTYHYRAWSYNIEYNCYSTDSAYATNKTDTNAWPEVDTSDITIKAEPYASVYNQYANISVTDADEDPVTVTLYWGNNTEIGNVTSPSGTDISISFADFIDPPWLLHVTNYTWYLTVTDGFYTVNTSHTGTYWFETSVSYDLNEDGIVSVEDVSMLVSTYGLTCRQGELPSDIDSNGIVNVLDISMLVYKYGWSR